MKSINFLAQEAITSLGVNWSDIWNSLVSGQRKVSFWDEFNLDFPLHVPVSGISMLERGSALEVQRAATKLGLMVLKKILPKGNKNIRIYGGSNHGETDVVLAVSQSLPEDPALWHSLVIDPMPETILGDHLGTWVYSACTSSLHALASAQFDLYDGETDEAIIVTADSLSAIGVAGFWRAGAITQTSCRPFHESRDGLLIGEGAAVLHMRYSEPTNSSEVLLLGIGMSCDASDPTDPNPDGNWLEQAIRQALLRAGLESKQISAIICHGTGTQKNDSAEARAIGRLWPNASVPVTSLKGAMGHTMGVSGLLNLLASIEATRQGLLPPTVSDGSKVIGEIDLVLSKPRSIPKGSPVLVISSGFGGNNFACIVGQ